MTEWDPDAEIKVWKHLMVWEHLNDGMLDKECRTEKLCLYIYVCLCAKSLQSYLTLCDPIDCSLPGSSVHGFLQARIVAISSSSRPSDPGIETTSLTFLALAGGFFTTSATWEALYVSVLWCQFCLKQTKVPVLLLLGWAAGVNLWVSENTSSFSSQSERGNIWVPQFSLLHGTAY